MSEKRSTAPNVVRTADVARRVGQSSTLAGLVVERGAHPLRALSAFYWIAAWGMFVDANGREPRNVDEVAAALGLSRRQAFRWQASFREVFEEYKSPATLWALVGGQEAAAGDDPEVVGLQLGGAQL